MSFLIGKPSNLISCTLNNKHSVKRKLQMYSEHLWNQLFCLSVRVRDMVFNATFNIISVISWWSVSFIGGGNLSTHRENHRPVASH
jgi:hypothetical protein